MTNQFLNIDKLETTPNDPNKVPEQKENLVCKPDVLSPDKLNTEKKENTSEYDGHPTWNDGSSIF